MAGANILTGKYFIQIKKGDHGAEAAELETSGQILGKAADGWFLVAFYGPGGSIRERRLVPVAALAACVFYNDENEMILVRRELGPAVVIARRSQEER